MFLWMARPRKFLCWLVLIPPICLCVRRGPTLIFGSLGPFRIFRPVRIHGYAGKFTTHKSTSLLFGDKPTRQDGMSCEGLGEGSKLWFVYEALATVVFFLFPTQNYPLHGADVNGFHSGSAAYSHTSSINGSDSILGKWPLTFLIECPLRCEMSL